jgi:3-oxoacyl-(acyl-carrier-protein) synthase
VRAPSWRAPIQTQPRSHNACAQVLERADHAKARGADILAQIAGVGMSADAADLVAPTLEGAVSAIRACLADANLSVDAIDYINAHGTEDITEIQVIKTVFGDGAKRLSISSTKSMHGHALGASGSFELIAVIEAIRPRYCSTHDQHRGTRSRMRSRRDTRLCACVRSGRC